MIDRSLVGYEIKSGADRLDRLSRQVAVYGRVFDRMVLVCDRRHLRRAQEVIPSWWGLWRADDVDGTVRLARLRAGRCNPGVEPLAVAQLLWRAEALELLAAHGLDRGLRTATRWTLWAAVAQHLPADQVRTAVRDRLRARSWS